MSTTKSLTFNALLTTAVVGLLVIAGCSSTNPAATSTADRASTVTDTADNTATCARHRAPEELCFICDPALREVGRLWCREHARYEDRCWECHPELEEPDRLWCAEHSLYEDECFLCHPELLENTRHTSEASSPLECTEHGVLEQDCGICHPELIGQPDRATGVKIRLTSSDSAQQAGVVVNRPEFQPLGVVVDGFAELAFNQNKLAHITSLVHGVVKSVEVDLGASVRRGQLLATIVSAEIGKAQAEYARALAEEDLHKAAFDRQRSLLAQQVVSEQAFQEAQAAHRLSLAEVRQARQRLEVLGFDSEQVAALDHTSSSSGVIELRAPFAGEIVERAAVLGSVAETADALFTLADTSTIWAMVNIPEPHIAYVRKGQDVSLTVDSLPGASFAGTLTWISASIDHRTRMAQGRIELKNSDSRLKAQMFAKARIFTTDPEPGLIIPLSAVQNVTGTSVVFIQAEEDLFEARPVTLGTKRGGQVQIKTGLYPGEPIVVVGGFAIKSQLLASRLGAGCADK